MRFNALIAAAFVSGLAVPLAAQSVKSGIAAWQRADYAKAVAIWRPLAEEGDADASFNLAQAYRLGRGVTPSLPAALLWFERAARNGHLDAQTTLGLLLFQNGDQAGGLKWLKQAADRGEPRALLIYGTALFNGDGVSRDPVLGYALVSRAAAQGLAAAKTTLAELDQILPLDQRKAGVALALRKANAAPGAGAKAAPSKPVKSTAATAKVARDPAKVPEAIRSPGPAGAWRIQLGAFSQRGAAEALYAKLPKSGPLAGRTAYYVPVGKITRLQVGPFASRAAAQAACASVKSQACFPVPSK